METKKVLTRQNIATDEIIETAEKLFKGIKLKFSEAFYYDYEVDENSGMISTTLSKHYTKNQMERNLKALKNAYLISKGAASPNEIINFRRRLHISASTLSVILGFSKNTISNIENEGIMSLSGGRLIKNCLENKNILYEYVQMCDSLDNNKKKIISEKLLRESD